MIRADDPWVGKRVLVVLHRDVSSPCEIGRILREGGATLDVRRPPLGDPLPDEHEGHDTAIVFGGPMSANDGDDWIRGEIDWIGDALRAGIPTLGICLGAQMLAKALGARVARHPTGYRETGFTPIRPAPGACATWSALPERVYQWHEEGVELPRGARLLASGDDFHVQAYAYGSGVGLQFHAEADLQLVDRLTSTIEFGGIVTPDVRERHLSDHARHGQGVLRWLDAFLRHWLPVEASSLAA